MPEVFISYSHNDVSIREAVVQKLENAGIKCWYAPRDIQPGEEWADAIIDGLKSCKVMILIFTASSNASVQVLREVGLAVDFKKTIIPFRCDGTMPSGSMQYYLSTLHWMDSSGDSDSSLDELLSLTRKSLAGEKQEGVPAAGSGTGTEKKAVSKKLVLWIAAVFLVLNIGLGIYLYFRGRGWSNGTPKHVNMNSELEELIADGVVMANGEDISQFDLAGQTWTVVDNKLYYFTTDVDSPGADDYLFALLDDNTVQLNDYNGEKKAEIVVPSVIDGLPVTVIGSFCFENDTFVEKITLPDTVDYIESSAFAGCTNLKKIVFSQILGDIGEFAFSESGLVSVVFPDSVKNIGAAAFMGCSMLESVFLPGSVQLIPQNAFQNTPNLKTVTVTAEKVFIDIDAFDPESDVTLIGIPGSYTETYANRMGLKFSSLK